MSNLDVAVIFGIWAGSIVFGWKQEAYWLAVPTVACIAYTAFLIFRHNAWAAKGLDLGRRKVFEMWMCGRAVSLALLTSLRRVGTGSVLKKVGMKFRATIWR